MDDYQNTICELEQTVLELQSYQGTELNFYVTKIKKIELVLSHIKNRFRESFSYQDLLDNGFKVDATIKYRREHNCSLSEAVKQIDFLIFCRGK